MTTTSEPIPADPRQLRATLDNMRAALVDLVEPIVKKQPRDDGRATEHIAPSLLDQLRRAVANGSGRPGGPRRSAPIPISADAYDLLRRIEQGSHWLVQHRGGDPVHDSIEGRLRSVVSHLGRTIELHPAEQTTADLRAWARSISVLFDPPKRWHIAKKCPACKKDVVQVWDATFSEYTRRPALEIEFDYTGLKPRAKRCRCVACNEEWPPDKFEFLAQVLGCEPLPTSPTEGTAA